MKKASANKIKVEGRKIVVLCLLSVYALFSVGVLKATHLCMGRIASVSFFTGEAKKCGCALFASEKSGCCEEDHDLVKIENDQKTPFTFQVSLPERPVMEEMRLSNVTTTSQLTQAVFYAPNADSPPRVPLFKFHCSLVFYDAEMIG